jgi:hypothetical protein
MLNNMPTWTCPKCGEKITTEAVYDMDGYYYGDKTSDEINQSVRIEHLEAIVDHQSICSVKKKKENPKKDKIKEMIVKQAIEFSQPKTL